MKSQAERTEWMDERLEAYVDGSLPAADRAHFQALADEDPRWQDSIELSLRIKKELREVQAPPCPDAVVEAVFAATRSRPGLFERIVSRMGNGLHGALLRPALALGVVLLAALVLLRPWGGNPPDMHEQAEIDAALADVKWTLAYLDDVGARAGSAIREQVLIDGVVRPIRTGLQMGLNKQEQHPSAN